MGMLVPACSLAGPSAAVRWTLRVEAQRTGAGAAAGGDLFQGRLFLELPYAGRRLALVGMEGGVMRLVAAYRRGAPPAVMEVDARQRVTRLLVAPDLSQRRLRVLTEV
ncbi:hypothetical protein ACWC1D_12125 [Streptomyces sp. NPDC001478]